MARCLMAPSHNLNQCMGFCGAHIRPFHRKCSRYQTRKMSLKNTCKNYCSISQGPSNGDLCLHQWAGSKFSTDSDKSKTFGRTFMDHIFHYVNSKFHNADATALKIWYRRFSATPVRKQWSHVFLALTHRHIEGILPKGPYLPCVSMAGRALLAGYPRYQDRNRSQRAFLKLD